MYFDDPAAVLPACVERLGDRSGPQLAAMTRRGFLLERPTGQASATGRCRLGGPALLDPGTAWPETAGVPLSLLAVLDLDALGGQLGEALPPQRPGLLNFFYADPDIPVAELLRLDTWDPSAWRVIPAESRTAVENPAPNPARSYPPVPVHAVDVTMLPDVCDVADSDVDFDKTRYWGVTQLLWESMQGLDGNTAGRHCAFGWPDTSYANIVTERDDDGPHIHLLQVAQDAGLGWSRGDAATLNFLIPAQALADGDFTRAHLKTQSC